MKQNNSPDRFVILCQNRTGSYLLVDLLGQFSDIMCHGEVFKPNAIELAGWVKGVVAMTIEEREKYPITYVNRLYRATPKKISGFKMFASHNNIARQYVLESRNITKIILTRSHIDTYISNQRARITGEWVNRIAQGRRKKDDSDLKIPFLPEVFEVHRQKAIEIQQEYAACETFTKQSFIRIAYEEVAQLEPVRLLARKLGSTAEPESLVPTLKKQITKPLEEIVENFDEMQRYLAKTAG